MLLDYYFDFNGSAGVPGGFRPFACITPDKPLLVVDGRYIEETLVLAQTHGYRTCLTQDFATALGVDAPTFGWDERFFVGGDRTYLLGQHPKACFEHFLIDDAFSDPPITSARYDEDLRNAELDPAYTRKVLAMVDKSFSGARPLDAYFFTFTEDVSLLFGLRGAQSPYTPFAPAYALVSRNSATIFWRDGAAIPIESNLFGRNIRPAPFSEVEPTLRRSLDEGARIGFDDPVTPLLFTRLFAGREGWINTPCPIRVEKLRKTPFDLAQTLEWQRDDCAAVSEFLYDLESKSSNWEGKSEYELAALLETYRANISGFRGRSFPWVSALDANASKPHYKPKPENATYAQHGSVYLIDSGGQYPHATTDITRVVLLGERLDGIEPLRNDYTQTLRAHIALATSVFPEGTSGAALDLVARQPLYKVGLDYQHGTGHGVGTYASVHEGHIRISPSCTEAVVAGLVLSNEPGVYRPHHYGIRIENLVSVVEADATVPASRPMLRLETLSYVPFDIRLINRNLLSQEELGWLRLYYGEMARRLSSKVSPGCLAWIESHLSWVEKGLTP
jgi:Xaa-Pro aminopeptidase